ncbi:MAG: hypothetical protein M3417_10970 [Actinomycetota bacterium]|nr:hypothetical protein [Actinomycetota bacterium]
MIGRLLACAVTVGCVGGAVAAVALPDRRAVAQNATVPLPPLRSAAAHRPSVSEVRLRTVGGAARIAATAPDPEGGPRWAVRTFLGERFVSQQIRRRGVSPIIGRNLCAQLGRVVDGRFGWIDGDNVFRPSAIGFSGGVTLCGSRRTGKPQFDARTVVRLPTGPDARLGPTVAWGAGGIGTQTVSLDVAGKPVVVRAGHLGAFLHLTGAPDDKVTGAVRYADGARVTLPTRTSGLPPGLRRGPTGRPQRDARPEIDARTPDPDGGPAYGIVVVPRVDGGVCFSASGHRIVEERAGSLDARLGTFTAQRFSALDCGTPDFAQSPLVFGYGGGSDPFQRAGVEARVARRSLPGRFSIYGRARPDVRSITIASPRDVRTVIPGPRSGAFLATYDGDFPAGEITLTAQLADGSMRVDRIALSF